VNPAGAARQRNIQPIVDDDARSRAAGERHHVSHQRGELSGVEIALAHLNEIDAALDGLFELRQQKPPGVVGRCAARRETAPVGDEAAHHGGVL